MSYFLTWNLLGFRRDGELNDCFVISYGPRPAGARVRGGTRNGIQADFALLNQISMGDSPIYHSLRVRHIVILRMADKPPEQSIGWVRQARWAGGFADSHSEFAAINMGSRLTYCRSRAFGGGVDAGLRWAGNVDGGRLFGNVGHVGTGAGRQIGGSYKFSCLPKH